ncbi:hypothetical protein GBA52_002063 [Prunus armeniaca]|nr:hypothetical protein GBA52_002063 [Prunus armeniaca]
MLYIVGLGLGDEKDITLRGLEAVKKCDQIFIEAYTSLLSFGLSSDGLSTLENLYGKPVTLADRETVEEKADQILSAAAASDVAFLVVGDPFGYVLFPSYVYKWSILLVLAFQFGYLLNGILLSYDENTMCVGLARLGSEDQKIVSGTMKELQLIDFGAPLHCLVIVGKTHPVEEEMLDFYRLKKQNVEGNDRGTV